MGKQKERNTVNEFDSIADFLNKNKTPIKSFGDILNNSKIATTPFTQNVDTKFIDTSKYTEYIRPSDTGAGLFPFEADYEKSRAVNQSNWEQFGHAIARFVPNVTLEVLNQTGALLDFEDYVNSDNEVGNWLSKWALEKKQERNEALPIYRENPNQAMNVGDFAWWMEMGGALAESVTAFALVGAATSAVGGAVINGISKGGKWLLNLSSTGNTGKKIAQSANTLSTAFLLNHAEGMGIAIGVYDEVYQRTLEELQAEGNPDAENLAKQKAATKAESALFVNKANILLNLSSASLFTKTPLLTRQVRKQSSVSNTLKTMNREGLQEGAEEIWNMISENQALDDDYSITKGLKDIMTLEGLENAFLGYIGGAGQTAITNAGRKIKLKRDDTGKLKFGIDTTQDDLYEAQQKSKATFESFTKGEKWANNTDVMMRSEEFLALKKEIEIAENNGDIKKANDLKSKLIQNQAYDAFANGTTEDYLRVFEAIKNLTEEEAVQKGFDATTYKEKAEEGIKYVTNLENAYNESQEYLNSSDIYNNRAENIYIRIAKDKLQKEEPVYRQKVEQELLELGISSENIDTSKNGYLKLVGLTKEQSDKTKQLTSVQEYDYVVKELTSLINKQKNLSEEYINLKSSKTQQEIKRKIAEERQKNKDKEKEEKSNTTKAKSNAKVNNIVNNAKQQATTNPPVSSVTGQTTNTSTQTPSIVPTVSTIPTTGLITNPSNDPTIQKMVDKMNTELEQDNTDDKKVERLEMYLELFTNNSSRDGVPGLIAQVNKALNIIKDKIVTDANTQANQSNLQNDINSKLAAIANAIVDADSDQSPITEENRAKIIENMNNLTNMLIDAMNLIEEAGYDITDFKVISDFFLKAIGEKALIKKFEQIKGIYNNTNLAPIVTASYEDLYFNEEEKKALQDQQDILAINAFLQDFYNLSEKDFNDKKTEVLKEYIESQGYSVYNKDTLTKYEGYKVVKGYNKIAYLAKHYSDNVRADNVKFNIFDFFVSREDVSRTLNTNTDEVLLDPQFLQAGDSITFKVINQVKYEDGTIVKSDGSITKNGETEIKNPIDVAPIALFYNGKQVKGGFLHEVKWINADNIARSNEVNTQQMLLRKIREAVLNAGERGVTTTIKERKDGFLLKDIKGKKDLVSNNLSKVDIAVGRDNNNLVQNDEIVETSNKNIIAGIPYVIIPVNKNKKIGIPVQPVSLSTKPEYIETIINALRIYLSNKPDTRINQLKEEANIDLQNIDDIEALLNTFIYLPPYKFKDNKYFTFDSFKTLLNNTKDDFSVVRIVRDSIQFGRGLRANPSNLTGIKALQENNGVGYLNKAEFNKLRNIHSNEEVDAAIENQLNILRNVLQNNMYINVNNKLLNTYFNKITITETKAKVEKEKYNDFIKKHLLTDLYSVTLDNGTEIYTVQGTIEFDDSFANKKPKIKNEPTPTTPTETKSQLGFDYDYFGDEDLSPLQNNSNNSQNNYTKTQKNLVELLTFDNLFMTKNNITSVQDILQLSQEQQGELIKKYCNQ